MTIYRIQTCKNKLGSYFHAFGL